MRLCVCTSITHYVQKMRYIQYILLYSAVRKHFTLSNCISKCTCLLLMWFYISYLCSCLTQSHKVNFVFVIKKFFPLCDYLEIIICLVPSSKICLICQKGSTWMRYIVQSKWQFMKLKSWGKLWIKSKRVSTFHIQCSPFNVYKLIFVFMRT